MSSPNRRLSEVDGRLSPFREKKSSVCVSGVSARSFTPYASEVGGVYTEPSAILSEMVRSERCDNWILDSCGMLKLNIRM